MATITFHTNTQGAAIGADPTLINHTAGSGLGFFGGSFGISVPVDQYQSATYVCNANGTASGVQCSNTKYDVANEEFPGSGTVLGAATAIGNSGVPNYQAPLNIRFEHDDPQGVRVQNCRLRIFDRNDINNHASGVTTQVYEVRHPNPVQDAGQTALELRGVTEEHAWVEYDPAEAPAQPQDMVFTAGPGPSGLNTTASDPLSEFAGPYRNWVSQSGTACRSTRHDWYVALSASPQEIGSKTNYGLYFTLEYL